MKRFIEIDTHARVTEKRKFQCLLCSGESSSQTLFETEIGVMAHMLYGHLITPDAVTIEGWTQKMADNLKEQIKRNSWDWEEDIPSSPRALQAQEARVFREGKVEIVKLKIRGVEHSRAQDV